MKAKEDKYMDLNEIKKLIEEDGGKIIIVENGKPVMVITSFQDYQNRLKPRQKPEKEIEKPLPQELAEEELKIEDLPF